MACYRREQFARSTVYKALSELCKILKISLTKYSVTKIFTWKTKHRNFPSEQALILKKIRFFPRRSRSFTNDGKQTVQGKKLKKLQRRLFELHNEIYLPADLFIIVFEGWDAAGKGRSHKTPLSEDSDPRGYEVIPISAPNEEERNKHYLWRFGHRFQNGHIAAHIRPLMVRRELWW